MQKLLYTTRNDLSIPHFTDWQIEYYDSTTGQASADLVYFRDPFNDPSYIADASKIDCLIKSHPNSYLIDHITKFDDITHAEDKYCQAQTYVEWSPQTWLPSQHEFTPGKTLAKPRISQRAKDILFELGDRVLDDSWIIQELLDIKEELRVYVVFGEILPIASIKSSKSTGAVKVIGTRPLNDQEKKFVNEIMTKCPLDVVGFDIASLSNGNLKLIEANRSPQFKRYVERTGLNISQIIDKNFQA